ncbi:TPA: phage major capsid protein, partial [Streptococcus agalactiae]
MSKLLELKEKRNAAWAQAKAFLDTVRSEDGLVSDEDSKRYEEMEAKIELYNKEIARLERQEKIDLELAQPTSQALTTQPTVIVDNQKEDEKKGVASDIYTQTFWTSVRKRNFYDVKDVLRVGEDTEGGHLVPDEYEKKLVQELQEENF